MHRGMLERLSWCQQEHVVSLLWLVEMRVSGALIGWNRTGRRTPQNAAMAARAGPLSQLRGVALVVGWAWAVKTYACDAIYGVGRSMEPVIPDGSVALVDRLSPRWRRYARGDVVLVRSPTRSDGSFVIKRILALEGDTVELQPRFDDARGGRVKVPKGHVWIEGDNATMSVDSRHIGAVPAALVNGRVRALVWPMQHASIVR